MTSSNEPAASHQFEASREVFSTSWIKGTKIWQAVYSVFFVAFVGWAVLAMFRTSHGAKMHAPRYTGLIMMAVLICASVVIGTYMWWRSRQSCLLSINGDALTVSTGSEVYSLAGGQLGLWPNFGVALHLHSSNRRFVLGGEHRQIGPATQLDAEPIQVVDARLQASEFDELLRLGGRAAAHGPASGDPVRCVLFANSQTIVNAGVFAFRTKQRLVNSLGRPRLFIDVDNETLRIVDPHNHSVEASASVSRITATPLSYEVHDPEMGTSKTPTVQMSMPSMEPFTFRCATLGGTQSDSSWPGAYYVVGDPPDYTLSKADWLTLVDTLGLAAHSQDATAGG